MFLTRQLVRATLGRRIQQILEKDPDERSNTDLLGAQLAQACAYGLWGKTDEAREILSSFGSGSPNEVLRGATYGAIGEPDQAFECLERAYEGRNPVLLGLAQGPMFDSLRDDPRFQDLLRRMNFPQQP